GWPKAMIEEAAAATAARIDRGEQVIVGVNKYRKDNEDPIDILDVDNHAVREAQIARINRVKAGRDEAACQAALDALREAARFPPTVRPEPVEGLPSSSSSDAEEGKAGLRQAQPERGLEHNLLARAVEAARARATLGEISLAMEDVF